jgi:hypothetical protein
MPSLQELDKGGEPKETHTSTSETAPPEKMDLPQDSCFDKLIIHTTGGHYYSPLTKGTGEPSGLATDHKEDSKVFCTLYTGAWPCDSILQTQKTLESSL